MRPIFLNAINRQTFGQLLKSLRASTASLEMLGTILWATLEARNRLQHSFSRQHNFRRSSDEGRITMLRDPDKIHEAILHAYEAVMRLSDIDLEAETAKPLLLPTCHIPM
jgi:nitroimidazol reductase NimA-like FMN-containing flavoprotein (pyridoxamine 5'-phosphate oxidase superfamily)